jgi:hypothetical protein
MGLIFDYEASDTESVEERNSQGSEDVQEKVALMHKRLWRSLRERLQSDGADQDLDGLKLLKGFADILLVITKTERLIWGMEEKAPGQEVYGEDEIAEAMAQITLPQRAGKAMDGE